VEFVSFEKEINNKLIFKSFVFINKTLFAEGIGTRKKASEQLAAKRALKNLTL
jgi:dsRNA-specific ribonuclease